MTAEEATTGGGGNLANDVFFLDAFAQRQFGAAASGSSPSIDFPQAEFVKRVHEAHATGSKLVDGYAPFCKHIFVDNFVGAKAGSIRITDSNRQQLRSGYTRRRPEELAVLARWFPADAVEAPVAKHLDVIMYSREQLVKEYDDMPAGKGGSADLPQAPWGIISIKAQDEPYETPMQPITIFRNSLGREEGGSGVPLNKAAYEASVAFWEDHAVIVSTPEGE